MGNNVLHIYMGASALICLMVMLISFSCLKKGRENGKLFSIVGVLVVIINVSYIFSIRTEEYHAFSLFSSIYFASIDLGLLCLVTLILNLTRTSAQSWNNKLIRVCWMYGVFDVFVMMINVKAEIVVHYIRRATEFSFYSYDKLPLYWGHLLFTYGLVLVALFLLTYKAISVPSQYRGQYLFSVIGILLIVALNAVFLFMPGNLVLNLVDISTVGYGVIYFLLYWSFSGYAHKSMLKELAMTVFGSLDQGIVLFDYDGYFVMNNSRAEQMIPALENHKENFKINEFCFVIGLDELDYSDYERIALQCKIGKEEKSEALRCDFQKMRHNHRSLQGYLFVFTDVAMEMDLLTQFHNWEPFRRYVMENAEQYHDNIAIAVLDINALAVFNSSFGREAGDKKIVELAELMREHMPKGAYFVRGNDAHLIAICPNHTEQEMLRSFNKIMASCSISVQAAAGEYNGEEGGLLEAIASVEQAMWRKKLLDKDSMHSEVVSSLLKALQQADLDTEAHVIRTQALGKKLGEKIGLTDAQLSDLALLCVLHDIGKIGVPLEILNKPGKLTNEEWEVLQSHVEKGYQIAKSSKELCGIAEMILRHHERWDGKGYPGGLSRESIPILARIIPIVDAYDAMVNNRSYRKKISLEQAYSELRRNAGTQFDPYLVSEFLQLLQENSSFSNYQISVEEADLSSIESDREWQIAVQPLVKNSHEIHHTRYILDDQDKIIEIDDEFEKMTGFSMSDIDSRNIHQIDLLPEQDRTDYLLLLNANMAKGNDAYFEHRIQRKDGSFIFALCYGRRYYDSASNTYRAEIIMANSSETYAVKSVIDTESMKSQERLRQWEDTYRRDPLTSLLNHAAFQNDVEMNLIEGNIVMMLMIDVDHFKQYNDTYGHSAGDEYLTLVATTLEDSLRKEDLPCRMGGDEFAAAIIFDEEPTTEVAYSRAKQVFDKINSAIKAFTNDDACGISMGVGISGTECTTFKTLYQNTDQVLYEAKKQGRGRLVFEEKNAAV